MSVLYTVLPLSEDVSAWLDEIGVPYAYGPVPSRNPTVRELRDELKGANKAAAEIVRDEARRIVPVRSGRLQRSITAQASTASGRVKAGSAKRVPYAGPTHFGWPTRPNRSKRWRGGPIKPNPWLYEAQDRRINEVRDAFERAAARWVDKVNE